MSEIRITPQPLSRDAFAAFGDVIETSGRSYIEINQGNTKSFELPAMLDTRDQDGFPRLSIYRSQPVSMPFQVQQLERHPLGSQAFMPLSGMPFLVVVAPPGDELLTESVQAFITDGQQGINYHKGVWHHYQLSLKQVCDYLVIDRGGAGDNCEERQLGKKLLIEY